MKEYRVTITERALSDMGEIYDYIAERLQSPAAAMRIYNSIAEEIESLSVFPERNMLMLSEPERAMGMRRLSVNHYSVFYIAGEAEVTVVRVLYSASDILSRLRDENS